MDSEIKFGSYMSAKRKERGLTLKDIAKKLDVSIVYLSDIENNRKAAPRKEHLDIIADCLELNGNERNTFYDLAANSIPGRKAISPDLPEYIMDNEVVRTALRTAKQYHIEDDEWQEFIDKITARSKKSDTGGK